MRIALVCPNVSSNSLVRTYPIAKVLARRHQLQMIGFRFGEGVFEPYRDEFHFEMAEAVRLPRFLAAVRRMVERIRADAVYVFKPLPSSLWVGLMARRALGVPLFLDIEDWEAGWYYDVPLADALRHLMHLERPNGFFWTWLSERFAGRADEVFVVSRFLQRRFGGTLLVHGADTAAFDPHRFDQAEARRRLGLDGGRYVVFTGSPMPNKGLEDLLDAVCALGDPSLKVLVVGSFRHDQGYRDRLQAQHSASLVLLGPRPHAEMPLFLAAADLVALPQRSSRETRAQVPGKVFEAMAMARPIVATAVSDLPEILDGSGHLVPPSAPQALATALEQVLADPGRAAAMGRAARARCEERYSWNAMESVLADRLDRWERT
jgi:glycosyltransferase involved in cell wall biosynthesis